MARLGSRGHQDSGLTAVPDSTPPLQDLAGSNQSLLRSAGAGCTTESSLSAPRRARTLDLHSTALIADSICSRSDGARRVPTTLAQQQGQLDQQLRFFPSGAVSKAPTPLHRDQFASGGTSLTGPEGG
ncbi:unnamed protein product [Natator depressus]